MLGIPVASSARSGALVIVSQSAGFQIGLCMAPLVAIYCHPAVTTFGRHSLHP